MHLKSLKHHNEQRIIAQYLRFDKAASNPNYSLTKRGLYAKYRDRMEADEGETGEIVALYIKGYIQDENCETNEERKELNKL